MAEMPIPIKDDPEPITPQNLLKKPSSKGLRVHNSPEMARMITQRRALEAKVDEKEFDVLGDIGANGKLSGVMSLIKGEDMGGKQHPDTLECINLLVWALSDQGKYMEAETIYHRALELRAKADGEEDLCTLTTMNRVGVGIGMQGKYDLAESAFRHVLEILEVEVFWLRSGRLSGRNSCHRRTPKVQITQHVKPFWRSEKAEQAVEDSTS